MLLDNFEKTREKINLELIKRLDTNKYNYIVNHFFAISLENT